MGADNFFAFGLTAAGAIERRRAPHLVQALLAADPELAGALDLIASGTFSRGDRTLFAPLVRSLVDGDPYLVLSDFRAYLAAQAEAAAAWRDPDRWTRSSILNVARCGRFSSDRAIREYAQQIWRLPPVTVSMT